MPSAATPVRRRTQNQRIGRSPNRGPKWEFLDLKPFTLPALFCGFKIRVTFPAAKEYLKVLKASDGSMTTLATGTLKVTFTSPSTGKAISANVSGPGKVTTHPDGTATFGLFKIRPNGTQRALIAELPFAPRLIDWGTHP